MQTMSEESTGTGQLVAGRYCLLRHLGSGGFGDTFLATDEQLPSGRQVVVKRLRPLKNDEPNCAAITAAFNREARILEQVGRDHDQIPELFAYFHENGAFWLVQQFISGPTLSSLGQIGYETARQLLQDLLPVLVFLHSRNILHRDIKPDNILLRDGDHKPVLIDFGAVRETMSTVVFSSGASGSSLVIGTQGFMPPEQTAGRAIFSSDLYALALTLISLLTGKLPQELPTDLVSGGVLWRAAAPSVDTALADLLDRAIQAIPAQRFPSAQAMLDALNATASSSFAPQSTQATVVVAPQQPIGNTFTHPVPPLPPVPADATYTPSPASRSNSSVVAITLSVIGLIVAIGVGLGALFISQQNQQQLQLAEARREAEQAKEQQQQLEKEKIEAEAQQRIAEARRDAIQAQRNPGYAAPTPIDNDGGMTDGTAVGIIENLYAALSDGQWTDAQQYYAPNTRDQFDPDFFAKFQRVTVSDLKVTSRTSDSLNLIGTNTFVWPDGSTQREERSFTVIPGLDGQPIVTSSEFIRVLKPRI